MDCFELPYLKVFELEHLLFAVAVPVIRDRFTLCDDLEQVLALVTCSYEWDSARNVLVAVRKAEVPVD